MLETLNVKEISSDISKIRVPVGSSSYELIKTAELKFWQKSGKSLFSSLYSKRKFSKKELNDSALIFIEPIEIFYPSGVDCGTIYAGGCEFCSLGRDVVGSLKLDTRSIPKSVDIACSVATDEIVVSERFFELLSAKSISGIDLHAIEGVNRPSEDTSLSKTIGGRKLLEKARSAGIFPGSAEFIAFINEDKNAELFDFSLAQSYHARKKTNQKHVTEKWYRLEVLQSLIEISSTNTFGDSPFGPLRSSFNVCPLGHVLGIRQFGKIAIAQNETSLREIQNSTKAVGRKLGIAVPHRLQFVSQAFYQTLLEWNIKGLVFEAVDSGPLLRTVE